jgi:hypothetical protein
VAAMGYSMTAMARDIDSDATGKKVRVAMVAALKKRE